MEEYHKRVHRRKTRPSDWNDECEVCSDDNSTEAVCGRVYKCKYCNVVAHKQCIEQQHNDLPTANDDHWTCWECAREINEVKHNSNCAECNEAEFISDDIRRGIKLLETLEQGEIATGGGGKGAMDVEGESDGEVSKYEEGQRVKARYKGKGRLYPGKISQVHGDGTYDVDFDDGDKDKGVQDENIESAEERRPATDSEILRARLQGTQQKEAEYNAHLIRDRNQAAYKGTHLAAMSIYAFYVLADYWAKLVRPFLKF